MLEEMKQLRNSLAIITLILLSFGLIMVYSASAIFAWERTGDSAYFLKRHFVFLLIGFVFSSLIMLYDYRKLAKYTKTLMFFSLCLLLLVLVPGLGKEVAGARRWFRLLGVGFQPSELTCFILIIYLADFLTRKKKDIMNFRQGVLPGLAVLGFAVGLLLLQPDLGTAILFVLVGLLLFFVAGIRLEQLFSLLALSIPVVYVLIFSVAYRKKRILAFLNPWLDPRGIGFQIIQAQIALGSGGILGLGLGQSRQKLFFLPAAHTDFIFSIISEELGLLGAATVIILFGLLLLICIQIISKIKEDFGRLLGFGFTAKIMSAAIINIGVNVGLFPTKGLPLPFVSYGGSALVFDMAAIGLLLNIARHSEIIEENR